jgi:hypothetical protein
MYGTRFGVTNFFWAVGEGTFIGNSRATTGYRLRRAPAIALRSFPFVSRSRSTDSLSRAPAPFPALVFFLRIVTRPRWIAEEYGEDVAGGWW